MPVPTHPSKRFECRAAWCSLIFALVMPTLALADPGEEPSASGPAAILNVERDAEDLPGRSETPPHEVAPDGYNIFSDPAPRDFRRPLGPDPHPYTTEPGRLQIEMEPLNFAYDRHNVERENRRTRAWEVPVNFKVGILHDVDVQLGLQAFAWEREDDVDAGTSARTHGFGDITLRSKINLWGNNEEINHALALMPFVTLPTARHDLGSRAVQGGMMVPFSIVPDDGWELQWSPHLAAIRDEADRGYELEAGSLLTLTRAVVDGVDVFVEFEAVGDTESRGDWAGSLNTGLTYELTPDTIVEGGVGFGVTRAADDFTSYIAIVRRF